jgi:Xaa-Pro aminopeptidase
MESYFTPAFFAGNRQRLKELFPGKSPIVISANGLLQRSADTTYSFRQDSNFWYMTGLEEPDLVLVMDKEKEYIILPPRNFYKDTFDGQIDNSLISKVSGLEEILDSKAGWKRLEARIKRVKHVATLPPADSYIEQIGIYTNPARSTLVKRLKEANPSLKLLDLRMHLARMRAIKQPEELKAIEAAVGITIRAFQKTAKNLGKYKNESEVESSITVEFIKNGVRRHGYEPIVAGGKNACTLHYIANNSQLSASQLLLIDAGAEVQNYSADITRTYSIGKPANRQKTVHQAVLEIQDFAISWLKPGILLKDYEKAVHDFAGEKLRELGLIKTISKENVQQYFPHAASHFLGLDVHDTGDPALPLAAGMVLTVEPGIYIAKEGIGVRIEDDVLITKNGAKVLSSKLSREL